MYERKQNGKSKINKYREISRGNLKVTNHFHYLEHAMTYESWTNIALLLRTWTALVKCGKPKKKYDMRNMFMLKIIPASCWYEYPTALLGVKSF